MGMGENRKSSFNAKNQSCYCTGKEERILRVIPYIDVSLLGRSLFAKEEHTNI